MTHQFRIRISPPELPIPEEKPYQFDRLNREPSGDLLTELVTHVETPCTIAIDAAWDAERLRF